MNARRILPTLVLCALLSGLLASCGPTSPATTVPTLPSPTATAVPTTPSPRSLTVCLGQEPNTLYLYGGTMLSSSHIQNAVYDGPIDGRTFGYQPVILEKLPSLTNGDAAFYRISVGTGDTVQTADDQVIMLTEEITIPIRLRPAGCNSDDCTTTWLPVSGTLEMEQMVVTFTLKAGVTWADGTPVTADDSVYSYQLYMDPESSSHIRYWVRTASYEAVDTRTIVWTGLPGYRDSAYQTNFWTPLPKHQLGHMTAAEIPVSDKGAKILLGYGPFTVQEWVEGDHVTVVRNPYYFRAEEGLPRLDQVIFRFTGENPNHALALLLVGECDILTQDISLDTVANQLIALESKNQAVPVIVIGTAFEHLDFGINPVETYDRPNFFEDVRMRQAIAMCLDRQRAIDTLLYGRSTVPASYIPREHPLHPPDLEPLPYDPQAGIALLEEMGWQDIDGDDVREAYGVTGIADGTKLAFKWSSTTASLRVAYIRIFREDLKTCGFRITMDNLPAGQIFADGPEGPLFGRHFDLASFTWLTGVEPPCVLYLCSQIPGEENNWLGQNNIGYCNPAFDAACQAALQALPGTWKHTYYHQEAQQIFAQDVPSLPLYVRLKIAAHRPEVRGLIMDPTVNSEMWNIEEFDKEP